jgi:hypothetical protein
MRMSWSVLLLSVLALVSPARGDDSDTELAKQTQFLFPR